MPQSNAMLYQMASAIQLALSSAQVGAEGSREAAQTGLRQNMHFASLAADDYHILFASAARDAGGYPPPYGPHVDISARDWHGGRLWFLPIIRK